MSAIHIMADEGEHPVYAEDQVRAMLTEGSLTPETYFWREGMAEWRPLGELFPAESAPAETPLEAEALPLEKPRKRSPSRRYQLRSNPGPLTLFLQVFYVFSLGLTAFSIYQCLDKIYGWSGSYPSDAVSQLVDNSDLADTQSLSLSNDDVTYLLHFLIVALSIHLMVEILFLCWLYRASRNCRGLASNMRFMPGWSVGYFFIPFLNLYRPYQVMQEIWKISKNPRSWIGRNDSIFVGVWFAVRFIPFIFCQGPFHTPYSDSDNPNVRMMSTVIYFATFELSILLVEVMSLILVSLVTSRQIKLARQNAT